MQKRKNEPIAFSRLTVRYASTCAGFFGAARWVRKPLKPLRGRRGEGSIDRATDRPSRATCSLSAHPHPARASLARFLLARLQPDPRNSRTPQEPINGTTLAFAPRGI